VSFKAGEMSWLSTYIPQQFIQNKFSQECRFLSFFIFLSLIHAAIKNLKRELKKRPSQNGTNALFAVPPNLSCYKQKIPGDAKWGKPASLFSGTIISEITMIYTLAL
jgi:hypothetical protein